MKALEVWLKIVEATKNDSVDVLSYKKIGDIPKWFSVSSNGFLLMFSECLFKKPKAEIQQPIIINYKEFEIVFPYYFKQQRVNRSDGIWAIQDYIFAVIKEFCFTDNSDINMLIDESETDLVSDSNPKGIYNIHL